MNNDSNDSGVPNPAGGANLPVINPNAPALTGPAAGITPTDLMSTIQDKLLSTTDAISSSSSNLEKTITDAIAKTQESGTSSKAAASSAYDREIADTTAKANVAEQGFLESQRGFAVNNAALKDLRDNNAKSIRDLEDRKQQALLSADADTASKISGLIVQKYEFEQQAQQQVFSNLISLSNFGLQQKQEQRLAATETFNEDSAKSNIALKYGIEVKPGDTFQDVVNRAKPFASAEEKTQMDQATANLALTQANTKKALADATAALRDSGKNDVTLGTNDFDVFIKSAVGTDPSATADALKAKILAITGLSAAQRQQGYAAVDTYFKNKASTDAAKTSTSSGLFNGTFSSPLANVGVGVGNFLDSASKSIVEFIFGKGSSQIGSK